MKKDKKAKKAEDLKKCSKKKKDKKKNLPSLLENFLTTAESYQQLKSMPRTFGNNIQLYTSEINLLTAIGAEANSNLTALANRMDVSKSATSKCANRLIDKGLVQKERSEKRMREVEFSLTAAGASVYRQILNEDKQLHKRFTQAFLKLDKDETFIINHFLTELDMTFRALTDIVQKPSSTMTNESDTI